VADELERPAEEPERHDAEPHLPSPTIWPFAFAGGLALVLVGLVVNWLIAAIGAGIAIVFGFLWIRDVTSEVRRPPAEPLAAAPPGVVEEEEEYEIERFPRSRFLEGATLGFGALIGGVVTLPALGFMVAPAFVDQGYDDVDLGPLENYPTDEFITATFVSNEGQGEVSRRTAFVRNNGLVNNVPSFTIISNRCVHLGCPTQPQGLPGKPQEIETTQGRITIAPAASVSGFQCPCHGGAYDDEGNRTAGPPVRALDRYEYSIREGSLWLGTPYSVSHVERKGAEARISAYRLADPGQHVDGPEQILYPFVP
jgi:Rieske Fe-S protein